MSIARRIGDHRSKVILGVLVFLSLTSLASGTRGGLLGGGVRAAVDIVSMPFLVSFDRIDSGVSYVSGLLLDYNDSRAEAESLHIEITQMQQLLAQGEEAARENERLRGMLAFSRRHSEFRLMSAEVLQHSSGVLTIDRGSIHNVRESMCVISPDGVIGLVTRVTPFTSHVATLASADCKIDAMIKWNRVRGRVYGSGNDMSALCMMHYIDLNGEVREGDEVVTSPDSVFPSGLPVGRIFGVPERKQLAQSTYIRPAADPFRVDEVFILLNASDDWRELSAEPWQGDAEIDTLDLSNTQTLQEHLAP